MWQSHFGDEVTAVSLATAESWRQAARFGRWRGVAAITACSSGLTIRTPANKWRFHWAAPSSLREPARLRLSQPRLRIL